MRSLFAVLVGAVSLFALALPAEAAFPLHAVVVSRAGDVVVARTSGATGIVGPGTYRFAIDRTTATPASGSEIDAIVDGSRGRLPRLTQVVVTPPFVAGLPSELHLRTLRAGDRLPDARLVDQNGRLVHLGQWTGKTLLLSFVYTRCPLLNVCPAVSGKFAYLQRHIDSAKTHLVVVTLDPAFDSPSVLARYGEKYGTDASRWSLVTGEQNVVKSLLDRLQIAPLEDSPGNIIHEEALVIADPSLTIRQVIPTPDWDPNGVLAEVRTEQGLAGNPFERLWLAAVAGIAAICGGESVASVLVVVFATFLCIAISAAIGAWFVWRLVRGERRVRKAG